MTAPSDRTALDRLEDELIQINGLARCLQIMSEGRYTANGEAFGYAGDCLRRHHDAMREAFNEIHKAMVAQQVAPG